MTAPLVLRPATAVDAAGLERLAALDSAAPLTGDVMLAYAGGEVRAALSVASGRSIADPFWRSAELVRLLDAAAKPPRSRRRRGLRLRRPALA